MGGYSRICNFDVSGGKKLTQEVQKMVAQAVVRYLNGDKKEFEKWVNMALVAYKKGQASICYSI